VARTESLGFRMFADSTPAMAAVPGGVAVAYLSWGDAVPLQGVLELFVVDESLAVVQRIQRPVFRSSYAGGALDMVFDDGVLALHWTGAFDDMETPATFVWGLGCE